MLHRRYLMSKFSEMLILVNRKIYSAFYPILHETFPNSYGFPFRGCLFEKKLVPLSVISRSPGFRWYGKSFLFSLCVYMIKRADSLIDISPLKGEILVSRMNRNLYKHFSSSAEVNVNWGAHAYDIPIQTMTSVKSITRHHWTNE